MSEAQRPFWRTLYFQVLAGIALGVLIGWLYPEFGRALKPLGDGFIKLVKMIITPVIFLTVVTGIAGMADLKAFGRVGAKALAYFMTFSTLALLIGLVESMRGREGGYWLAKPPSEISYGQIVRLTRGSLGLLPCASRLAHQPCKNCIGEEECRLHRAMLLVRDETARILDGLTLADQVEVEPLADPLAELRPA